MVPKCQNPSGLGDFRPINLVGVICKAISKVVANWFKKVVPSIISESQSAFLKGRLIFLVVNEIFSWAKANKKKVFLFKIDFEKAYDNVNWGFVFVCVCFER